MLQLRRYTVTFVVLAAVAGSTFQLLAATEVPTGFDRITKLPGDYLIEMKSGPSQSRRVFNASVCDIGGHVFLKCHTYSNRRGIEGAFEPITSYISLDSVESITELPKTES